MSSRVMSCVWWNVCVLRMRSPRIVLLSRLKTTAEWGETPNRRDNVRNYHPNWYDVVSEMCVDNVTDCFGCRLGSLYSPPRFAVGNINVPTPPFFFSTHISLRLGGWRSVRKIEFLFGLYTGLLLCIKANILKIKSHFCRYFPHLAQKLTQKSRGLIPGVNQI